VANLSHPNIVNVHDVVEEADSAFIVMEYIEGDSLSAYLEKLPVPDPAFSIQILRQMAAALDYAHGKGVIHRDIKPGNVMLGSSGIAKLVDFGIARISDARTSTPTGFMAGTAAYMSPEQFTGSALDGRADQYSLAAVGYEMITGATLFGEHALPVMAYKAVNEVPPAPSTRNAALPRLVDVALTKALAKSPADRYRTCAEFVDAMDQAIAGRALAPSANLPAAQTAASAKHSPSVWWAAGLGAIILAGVGLAIWRPWVRAPEPAPVTTASTPAAQPITQPSPPPGAKPKARPTTATRGQGADTPRRQTAEQPVPVEPPAVKPSVKADPREESTTRTSVPQTPAERPVQPAFAEAFRRGQEQMKAHDYQAAIQSFSSAISQRPDHSPAYYSRGQAHQLLLEDEAAIRDFNEAIRLKPDGPLAYVGRGACFVRLHRDDAAFADFNRALELRADLPFALNGRGAVLLRRRQYEQAIRDFTAAISLNPHSVLAYRNRAAARKAIGDIAGAKADRKAAENERGQEP
jgi:serine/threonine-protein kinase